MRPPLKLVPDENLYSLVYCILSFYKTPSYLSEYSFYYLLLLAPFNSFQPGVEQQVLFCCQLGMMDIKLRAHSQVTMNSTDLRGDVVASYSGRA